MRLGLYGGSFDPPHLGHLLPIIDAAETLALDAVQFVTAAQQPFKVGQAEATAEHRVAMTERLVAGFPPFSASRAEIDRTGLSYTVDTLAALAAAHPRDELVLLLGADAFTLFDQWREPDRIRQMATIAVLARGDTPVAGGSVTGVLVLQSRRVDISSTELRVRVADGRTIRGFTPDAVADYIVAHGLYR